MKLIDFIMIISINAIVSLAILFAWTKYTKPKEYAVIDIKRVIEPINNNFINKTKYMTSQGDVAIIYNETTKQVDAILEAVNRYAITNEIIIIDKNAILGGVEHDLTDELIRTLLSK